jgi:hypothetical protein
MTLKAGGFLSFWKRCVFLSCNASVDNCPVKSSQLTYIYGP